MRERAIKVQSFSGDDFMGEYFHFQMDPELKANYEFDWKKAKLTKKNNEPQLTDMLGIQTSDEDSDSGIKIESSQKEETKSMSSLRSVSTR